MKSMRQKLRRTFIGWGVLALLLLIVFLLVLRGVLWFNMPSRKRYPMRGVDVSHYQGSIDWETLAKQGIRFAFIKATEGSGTVDECYADNWENAQAAGIVVGAYHFFSFDSPIDTQLENFCSVVPVTEDALPPVIDLEYYRSDNLPAAETVQSDLHILLENLQSYYGKQPIIYTTQSCYEDYLRKSDLQYTLWIRSIFTAPSKNLTPQWSFWQYHPRGILEGYTGGGEYIDLDVYRGTEDEFYAEFFPDAE